MDIYADVIERLCGLGYNASDACEYDIVCSIDKARERILAETNQTEVPEGLKYVWIDMAAGAFLRDRLAAGNLGEGFDFNGEAKRITEGDVTVELNAGTPRQTMFSSLLDRMADPPKAVFAAFRRLTW